MCESHELGGILRGVDFDRLEGCEMCFELCFKETLGSRWKHRRRKLARKEEIMFNVNFNMFYYDHSQSVVISWYINIWEGKSKPETDGYLRGVLLPKGPEIT